MWYIGASASSKARRQQYIFIYYIIYMVLVCGACYQFVGFVDKEKFFFSGIQLLLQPHWLGYISFLRLYSNAFSHFPIILRAENETEFIWFPWNFTRNSHKSHREYNEALEQLCAASLMHWKYEYSQNTVIISIPESIKIHLILTFVRTNDGKRGKREWARIEIEMLYIIFIYYNEIKIGHCFVPYTIHDMHHLYIVHINGT